MKNLRFEVTLEPVDAATLSELEGLVDIKDVRLIKPNANGRTPIGKKSYRTQFPSITLLIMGNPAKAGSGLGEFIIEELVKWEALRKAAKTRAQITTYIRNRLKAENKPWAPTGVGPTITKLIRNGALKVQHDAD